MIFFSRETSERLAKLGCESENAHDAWAPECELYTDGLPGNWCLINLPISARNLRLKTFIPAFSQNDLTGCSEQARENAMIVWGSFNVSGECPCCCNDNPTIPSFARHRHAMIDAPDAEKYLLETLI